MILRRPEDVGLLVRDRRRAAGWSQAALAAAVGSSRQWVVELERGNGGAEIGRVLRALALLGVSLDALVAASTPPTSHVGVGEGANAPGPSRARDWSSDAFSLPSLEEVLGERPAEPPRGDPPRVEDAGSPLAPPASQSQARPTRATRKAR